jgi:hypothetical protein
VTGLRYHANRCRISQESSSVMDSQTNFLRVIDMVARGVVAVGIRRTEKVAKACWLLTYNSREG